MDKPSWCPDSSCKILCFKETKGGGGCIGELSSPVGHITKASNNLSWCHYVHGHQPIQFLDNQYDLIASVYLIGEALRELGLKLPKAIVDNLPV